MHEKDRGRIDISRSPRLNLEKLCALLHKKNKHVTMVFGFWDTLSWPSWATELKPHSIIPSGAIDPNAPRFTLTALPPWHDPRFRKPFLEFVTITFDILKLYRTPEGPITTFRFDPGLFSYALDQSEDSYLEEALSLSFPNCRSFNVAFSTSFSEASARIVKKNLSLLLQKRPWILCRLLRTASEKRLSDWCEEINTILGPDRNPHTTTQSELKMDVIVENSTFLEFHSHPLQLFPFTPDGLLSNDIVHSFKSAFRVLSEVRCEPSLRWSRKANTKTTIVYCEKYYPRVSAETLRAFIQNGARVFFPNGVPVYDEYLEPLLLGVFHATEERVLQNVNVRLSNIGDGVAIVPIERAERSVRTWCEMLKDLE
jgi:hypothetical protein